MSEVLNANTAILVAAVLAAAILLYLLLKPRQRVRLSQDTPLRPHLAQPRPDKAVAPQAAQAPTALAGEAAVATAQFIGANTPAASDVADDFQRLKGVGPKFAQMLQARGFFRFDQLASLTAEEIARLDPHLGAFRGRIVRDRIVEQADCLARGDEDAFQERFGKL